MKLEVLSKMKESSSSKGNHKAENVESVVKQGHSSSIYSYISSWGGGTA